MDAALRRLGALVVVVGLVAGTAGPVAAITEEDLRNLRLQLQEALGELETATWDHRIAVDNIGLVQYEYDALALDAEAARRDLAAAQETTAIRSLELFVGRRDGAWSTRTIAHRYLQAALDADRENLAADQNAIGDLDAGLDFLAAEIEQFVAAESDAAARVGEWETKVAELDADYGALAAAYEVELQFLATSTTTTTAPPATTTTSTTLPPTTTTTTVPPATTTTSTPPSTTRGTTGRSPRTCATCRPTRWARAPASRRAASPRRRRPGWQGPGSPSCAPRPSP